MRRWWSLCSRQAKARDSLEFERLPSGPGAGQDRRCSLPSRGPGPRADARLEGDPVCRAQQFRGPALVFLSHGHGLLTPERPHRTRPSSGEATCRGRAWARWVGLPPTGGAAPHPAAREPPGGGRAAGPCRHSPRARCSPRPPPARAGSGPACLLCGLLSGPSPAPRPQLPPASAQATRHGSGSSRGSSVQIFL